MKLNKKGFTLIELLAVVVIMLAISVMAVSSISAAIKRNAKKQDEAKQKVLATYGELYYQKYKNSLSISGSGCIYVDSLSEYTSEEELNDSDGNPFTGCITYSNGASFKYSDDCSGCR